MYSKGKKLFTSLFIVCFVLVQVLFTSTAFAQSADDEKALKAARTSVEALEELVNGEINTVEDLLAALVALENANLTVDNLDEGVKARWQKRFEEARNAFRIEQQKIHLRDSRIVAIMHQLTEESEKLRRFYILNWKDQFDAAKITGQLQLKVPKGWVPEGFLNQRMLWLEDNNENNLPYLSPDLSLNDQFVLGDPDTYIIVSVIEPKLYTIDPEEGILYQPTEFNDSITKTPISVGQLPYGWDEHDPYLGVEDGQVFLIDNNMEWVKYEGVDYVNDDEPFHVDIVNVELSKGDISKVVPVYVLIQGEPSWWDEEGNHHDDQHDHDGDIKM